MWKVESPPTHDVNRDSKTSATTFMGEDAEQNAGGENEEVWEYPGIEIGN